MFFTINNVDELKYILKYTKAPSRSFYFIKCNICGSFCKRNYRYLKQHNFECPSPCHRCSIKISANSLEVKTKKHNSMVNKSIEEKQLIREKSKQTCLIKYGTEFSFQSENNKNKSAQTKLEKYNDKNYNNSELAFFNKYGVTHDDYIKQKQLEKQIKREKYLEYIKTPEFKKMRSNNAKKARETILERYTEEEIKSFGKKTMITKRLKNNGAAMSNETKQKMKQTCLERYGVDSYAKTGNIHRSLYTEDNINFDSSWELAFYRYLKANDIKCKIHSAVFEYEYNNSMHTYIVDFEIDNNYYEIKGDHFFKDNKMINPFDRTQDELYEAKHQCMLKNNVIILKYKELKELGVFDYLQDK